MERPLRPLQDCNPPPPARARKSAMDHILQLHVEHHASSSSGSGVARLGKGSGDAPRAVVAFAAIVASLAMLLLPSFFSVVTARTALFVLSNAIFALLAADCRWFFSAADGASAAAIDACCELPAADVLEKQHGRRHHQKEAAAVQRCAVQPCAPYSAEHENSGTASETFREPGVASDSTSTTALEVQEEQEEDVPAATSTPELLGLDELGIDELNRKFDEFIQSRRNRWLKEEACLLAVAPGSLTC